MQDPMLDQHRYFLKDSIRKTIDFSQTDQSQRVPPPPIEKPFNPNAERFDLVPPSEFGELGNIDLFSAIQRRRSRRNFGEDPLSLVDISFLLWATQGIRSRMYSGHALRTVPSAGARHALETYLCVLNIEGLDTGFYRYLPLEHQLLLKQKDFRAGKRIAEAAFHQNWMATGAAVFIWTAISYRMEWRYGLSAHRVILLDAGHVCQNLYLGCEAIDAGMCAVAAYDQELTDELLMLDGIDEFAIYMAAVGKRKEHSAKDPE